MPPAISVVPFSYILGGNTVFALLGTTGLYLAALGLTPVITMLLLGTELLNPVELLLMLVQLIVVPLGISRILLFKGLAQGIDKWRDTAINWCIFMVTFTIIGLNREVFFGQPDVLLKVAIIAAAVTFGIGHATNYIAGKLHIDRPTSISWVVMSTRKNTGLASLVAIAFSAKGQHSRQPSVLYSRFRPLYGGDSTLREEVKQTCKPSSVLRSSVRSGGHSSSPDVAIRVKRPTRGQAERPYVPLFGLAPDGVCPADQSPGRW